MKHCTAVQALAVNAALTLAAIVLVVAVITY